MKGIIPLLGFLIAGGIATVIAGAGGLIFTQTLSSTANTTTTFTANMANIAIRVGILVFSLFVGWKVLENQGKGKGRFFDIKSVLILLVVFFTLIFLLSSTNITAFQSVYRSVIVP